MPRTQYRHQRSQRPRRRQVSLVVRNHGERLGKRSLRVEIQYGHAAVGGAFAQIVALRSEAVHQAEQCVAVADDQHIVPVTQVASTVYALKSTAQSFMSKRVMQQPNKGE